MNLKGMLFQCEFVDFYNVLARNSINLSAGKEFYSYLQLI